MRRNLHTTIVGGASVAILIITVFVLINSSTNRNSAVSRSFVAVDAQQLVRVWSGTWSGHSFGRNNPGQPQPTAPVSGTWILNLEAVDTVNNTASGTLTWHGRDAFWTYELQPNGTFIATPHDFIPNRTIQFNSSNTVLTSPMPGGGPQYHLTIEGFANAPNPSDAFYGPWFSVDLFPELGEVRSAGNGFSTHPYNPANFDTAISNGTVVGGNLSCTTGQTFSNVQLPEITIPHQFTRKPWQIRYGSLALQFTTVSPPPNAICLARSNVGTLDILGAPFIVNNGITIVGPFILFGHTVASASLTIFKGSTLAGLPSCSFIPVVGTRNNCLLNGPFDANAYYAMWHTTGFSVGVNVLRDRGVQDFIHTPPMTFFVNLDARNLSPKKTTIEGIIRGVEPYIHTTLISNLPIIDYFTIVQDPGRVSLFVVKDGVFGTGVSGSRGLVTDIPRSLYYQSETNPAVILLAPDAGNYKIFVNGVATGDYTLEAGTVRFSENTIQQGSVSGAITQGNSIVYDLNLTNTSGGVTQTFNSTPVPTPSIELVMEATGSPSDSGAILDSLLRTRDPFLKVNPVSVIDRGSDMRTRVQLFVSYLQLAPGEPHSAVSVEARDNANNAFPLVVEDVRLVPHTNLAQVTVRLSEELPNGKLLLRVGFRGKVTNPGAIMIQ